MAAWSSKVASRRCGIITAEGIYPNQVFVRTQYHSHRYTNAYAEDSPITVVASDLRLRPILLVLVDPQR